MNTHFSEGRISWTVERSMDLNDPGFAWERFSDGFIVFSEKEIRYGGTMPANRHERFGLLMEAGLWGHDPNLEQSYEIALSREPDGFRVESWVLDMRDVKESNCFYRTADIQPSGRLFEAGELGALEIIAASYRLHFFLTTAGKGGVS